ncbi:unnamed protein product [Discosporangium mesarthrocarpum]
MEQPTVVHPKGDPLHRGCWFTIFEVIKVHAKAIAFWITFGIAVLILTATGSPTSLLVGAMLLISAAAVVMTRYLWMRMFLPFLTGFFGAKTVDRINGGGCCTYSCCCGCMGKPGEGLKVKAVRWLLVLTHVAIYAIAGSSFYAEIALPTRNGVDPHPYTYFSMQWTGGLVLLWLSFWLADLFMLGLRLLLKVGRSVKRGTSLLNKWPWWQTPALACFAFVTLVAVSSEQGVKTPRTAVVEVAVPTLPLCLDGYKLAMIADIHAGPSVGQSEVRRHVEKANSLGGDAILILGDLVDDGVEDIDTIVEPVGGLSAPDGVYFVNGNHEHYYNAGRWAEYLTSLNITVLNNEHTTLPLGEAGVCSFTLAGVDDFDTDPDYEAALSGRDEEKATVLMAHQPRQVVQAVDYGVDLQLSAHTHGGQVFPGQILVWIDQGYIAGLHKRYDTYLYVTEGTVGWGPRMRLMSQTEYTLVILRSPEASTGSAIRISGPKQVAIGGLVLICLTGIYILVYPLYKTALRVGRQRISVDGAQGHEGGCQVQEEGLTSASGAELPA